MSEARAYSAAAQTDLELVAAPGTGKVIVVEHVHLSAAGAVNVSLSSGLLVSTKEVTNIDRGTSTGGDYTLTVNGQETAAIAFGAIGTTVKAALELLTTVTAVTVTGTGTVGDPWVATWDDPIGPTTVTGDGAGLTGGDSTLTVAQDTAGVSSRRWRHDFGAAGGEPSGGAGRLFTCEANEPLNMTTSGAVAVFASVEYQIRDVGNEG